MLCVGAGGSAAGVWGVGGLGVGVRVGVEEYTEPHGN